MKNIGDLAAQLIELTQERNEYQIQDDQLAAKKFCPRGLSRKMIRESIRDIDLEYTEILAQMLMIASGEGLATDLWSALPPVSGVETVVPVGPIPAQNAAKAPRTRRKAA
jgi:hypothetical protein